MYNFSRLRLAFWLSISVFAIMLTTALVLSEGSDDSDLGLIERMAKSPPYIWLLDFEKRLLTPAQESFEAPQASPEVVRENQLLWWVQLGAYASTEQAQARWQQFQEFYPQILANFEPHFSSEGGAGSESDESTKSEVVRLRIGKLEDKDAALNLCLEIRSSGGECFVVSDVP